VVCAVSLDVLAPVTGMVRAAAAVGGWRGRITKGTRGGHGSRVPSRAPGLLWRPPDGDAAVEREAVLDGSK